MRDERESEREDEAHRAGGIRMTLMTREREREMTREREKMTREREREKMKRIAREVLG